MNNIISCKGMCVYLATALSRGFVAVLIKTFAYITIAGPTHWLAPPTFRTRLLHSVVKD